MEDEVLIDDIPLNLGDLGDDFYYGHETDNEREYHHVIYAANGIAISVPPHWDSFSMSIETNKYQAWWDLREKGFHAFRKDRDNPNIKLFTVTHEDPFEAFCQCETNEKGKKKIIYSTEADFDKFIERHLNLRVFI